MTMREHWHPSCAPLTVVFLPRRLWTGVQAPMPAPFSGAPWRKNGQTRTIKRALCFRGEAPSNPPADAGRRVRGGPVAGAGGGPIRCDGELGSYMMVIFSG
eukprot:scaffold3163_cov139-Isochrysis_galbana.AAC.1